MTERTFTAAERNDLIASLRTHAHIYPHWAGMDNKAIAIIRQLERQAAAESARWAQLKARLESAPADTVVSRRELLNEFFPDWFDAARLEGERPT